MTGDLKEVFCHEQITEGLELELVSLKISLSLGAFVYLRSHSCSVHYFELNHNVPLFPSIFHVNDSNFQGVHPYHS